MSGVAPIAIAMNPGPTQNVIWSQMIGLISGPKRRVYIVKWGRTGRKFWSFHFTLLVTNDSGNENVSARSTGIIFDWGSIVDGKIVTSDIPVKIKPFTSNEYHLGIAMGNEYEFVGWTDWDDESIVVLGNLESWSYPHKAAIG